MHFTLQKILAGSVLLTLAAIAAAHAEIDFNTHEVPSELASALPNEGSSSPQPNVKMVEAARDNSFGGAIFNPFSPPAEPPSPAPAVVAASPAAPEPDSTATLTLILCAVGAVLAAWFLGRLRAPRRRSAP